MDAAACRIPRNRISIGIRWCGDGTVPVCCHDARHQYRKYAARFLATHASSLASRWLNYYRNGDSVSAQFLSTDTPLPLNNLRSASNTGDLGRLIYSDYLYAFEIVGVILLVAMIAAVALTLRQRKDSKSQHVADQVRVRRQDRVKLVSMSAQASTPHDTNQ